MHPIHDADALLLLAVTLASKRKPAALTEVVIALAQIQPRLPAEARLLEAFARLTSHGLILATAEHYTLSDEAQKIMAKVPKKGDAAERTFNLKAVLSSQELSASQPEVQPCADALAAEISAWQASLPPPTKTEKFEARKQEQRGPSRPRSRY